VGGLEGIDKRVGRWGKVKAHGLRSMGRLFCMMRGKVARDPPSAVGGLEGIDKRVGSWGKKEKERMKEKNIWRAPADLHPPLNKKWWA